MGGASTQHEKSLILPNSEVGQSLIMQYTFVCRLLQGTYFLNAGVTTLDDGDFKYLHRIVDAYAFRVAPEYLSIKNGKVDFDFEAKILKQ
jgi:lipopolysaccharide transport system ATP-binding protein